MIDIHCHILPGIDDGPATLATSLAMAARAEQDGIRALIATPHTDGIQVNREIVDAAVRDLNLELRRRELLLEVLPGYEIPYHLAMPLASTHTLANNTRHVLIEFPYNHLPRGAMNTFFELIGAGLVPILAHPERNDAVIDNPDILRDLVNNGILVQITAASITGELGPDILRCSQYLLKKNMVHFLATDAHSLTYREPVLSKAVQAVSRLIGPEKTRTLVADNPRRIITTTPPPAV